MKKFVVLFTITLFIMSNLSAKSIHVPGEFATIQLAIDASENGDTVLVSPGEYFENINFNGKNIVVASTFILSGDRSLIESTIINGSSPDNNRRASCVLIISGENRNAVLEGFTITGGTGTLWTDEHGAGDYYEGGGILIALSSPIIRNNIIENNSVLRVGPEAVSAGGGGIRAGDGNPLIINNIVRNNTGMYGGGIVMNYAKGELWNNLIYNNTVKGANFRSETFGGGGLWCNVCDTTVVINNTIVNNSSSGGGTYEVAGKGGGALFWSSRMICKNNIIWSNSQSAGGNLFEYTPGPSTIYYNNTEEIYDGTGNISSDPLFESETYLLNDESPSIDAGDPNDNYNDRMDEENPALPLYPSKGSLRNDQGVYGGPHSLIIPKTSTGVSGDDNAGKVGQFKILKNFPNPFNPSTTIEFSIDKSAYVSISIFNSIGQKIIDLTEGFFNSGTHKELFRPQNLSSGVYTAVLNIDGKIEYSSKIMLVK